MTLIKIDEITLRTLFIWARTLNGWKPVALYFQEEEGKTVCYACKRDTIGLDPIAKTTIKADAQEALQFEQEES